MFRIFEKLGGEAATLAVLERRRGKRLSSHSVRLWKFERKIPPVNVIELMDECAALGVPVSIEDFRLPEKPKSKSFLRTPPRKQGSARP